MKNRLRDLLVGMSLLLAWQALHKSCAAITGRITSSTNPRFSL